MSQTSRKIRTAKNLRKGWQERPAVEDTAEAASAGASSGTEGEEGESDPFASAQPAATSGSKMEAVLRVVKSMGTRITPYSGEKDQNLRDFLEDLEVLGESQQFDGAQVCALVRHFTTGAARSWTRACGLNEWQPFKDAMCARFSMATDLQRAVAMLISLGGRSGSTPSTVALNDFQKCMDLLEGVKQRLPDRLQVEILCASLPKDFAADVRARHFPTAHAACEFVAARATVVEDSEERAGRKGRNWPSGQHREGKQKVGTPGRQPAGQGEKRKSDTEHEVSARPIPPNFSGCYNCGDMSHFARNCPGKTKGEERATKN